MIEGDCDTTFRFGKYQDFKVSNIVIRDRTYCEKIIRQPWLEQQDRELFECLFYNLLKKRIDKAQQYSDACISLQKFKGEYFAFGIYKNRRIDLIWTIDKDYCKRITKNLIICEFQDQSIRTIRKLWEDENNDK